MTRAVELELLDNKKKMVSGTYLRNAWYVAAWSDDLADGQLLSRTSDMSPHCRTAVRTDSHLCTWARSSEAIAFNVLIMGWNSTRPALAS
jgi:hypothetical protein